MKNILLFFKKNPVLCKISSCWMKFSRILGFVLSRIIFSIIYIIVIGIYALIYKLVHILGLDNNRVTHNTYWQVKPNNKPSLDSMRRQF